MYRCRMSEKAVAVIPAGGSGKRMGGDLSKQYLLLAGKPILAHTLERFQESGVVSAVVLVVPAEDVASVRQAIVERYRLTKVKAIVPGGTERQDSVRNGLDAAGEGYGITLIHDGVRPFITDDLINCAVRDAEVFGAVTIGCPAKDTMKNVSAEGFVQSTLPRDSIWTIQTPQAFRTGIIVKAHKQAVADAYYGTDDASLVERIGLPVKVLAGSYDNIKITTKEDLALAERIMTREGVT
jgi:2-C-methyl-D-erythritol 4-phosphate cytidylyltransferase